MRRLAGVAFLFSSLGMLLCGCEMSYILSQGYGQVKLLAARRPLESVLADPTVSESIKGRLRLVQEVCKFAEKELGLKAGKSYRSFVEMPGEVVAYVVSGSPKDRLEPYLWRFPLLGSFPYKGFFNLEEAKEEKERLEGEGFDTHLAGATAFSALGWFADPIYSPMLKLEEIELCYTIFHELVHATFFFPDQVEFNEQLATLVGWQATFLFFSARHNGPHEMERVMELLEEEQALARVLEEIRRDLDTLYVSSLPLEEKLRGKEVIFEKAKASLGHLGAAGRGKRLAALAHMKWNNASFLALWRYRYDVGELSRLLAKLGGDLRSMIRLLSSWLEQGADPLSKLQQELGS